MATLVNKVRAITGSNSTSVSDANVLEFLEDGYDYILNQLPIEILFFAGSDSSSITSGAGYDITNQHVLSVRRGNYSCVEIPESMAYTQETDTESLYKATTIFPVFYARNGRIYIKPNPTGVCHGKITKLDPVSITSASTSSVYRPFDAVAVLYAAALDSYAQSGYWRNKWMSDLDDDSGDFRDALNKAKYLVDSSTNLSQGQDLEYYLAQEDTEMMGAIVVTAKQEIERALAEIQNGSVSNQMMQQYIIKAKELFAQADARLIALMRGQNDTARSDGESR